MNPTIQPVRADDIPTLARICFEAFGTLQDRHGVERDFDSVDTAAMMLGMFVSNPHFAGFTASRDGRVLGSNFIGFADPVAGVGPITVDPKAQAAGVGRALMLAVMQEAQRRGVRQVRLQQEAINTASLSLYSKLGFQWREACALIRLEPGPTLTADSRDDSAAIRPLTLGDLDEVERISLRHYHNSRRAEVEGFLRMGFPGFGMIASPRTPEMLVGYCFVGFLGHGFAETPAQLAALISHAARHSPPPFRKALIPLSDHELHTSLLDRGCRTIKLFNYMTTGEFRRPVSAWFPSIGN